MRQRASGATGTNAMNRPKDHILYSLVLHSLPGVLLVGALAVAACGIEVSVLAIRALAACVLSQLAFAAAQDGQWPQREREEPEDIPIEDRPADPSGIMSEAPGPASTSIREGWRWKWR
jgi:hypothetical protein